MIVKLKEKNEILQNYIQIIKYNNFKSNDILIFTDNSVASLNYIRQIDINISEELKIRTYSQFVREEVTTYWPIILSSCKNIIKKDLVPTFISTNLKTYIFEKKIEEMRNKNSYFEDVTGTNRAIASNIMNNLDHAIYNEIDYKNIGEKVYNSKANKDNINNKSYIQMNEIIEEYMDEMISNSIIDNTISVYLYNNYLLKDKIYKDQLAKRYNYLFVDDLQNISASQVSLIEFFEEKEKQIYLYLDNSKYFSSFIKNDLKYIHNKLLIQEENYSNIGIFDLINMPAKIELDQSSQLYGEMIYNIALKIEKLVEQGVSKKDIVIINPINTPVLDYEISNKLSSKNIDILTIKNNSKLIDYQYGNVLYVAVTIYCKKQKYIKEEEYINFIQILFDLNRLEAYRVYKNRDNDENYKSVIKYIDTKRDEKLNIGEFLTKFYIDKVLNLKEGLNNVFICKNIISESESFVDVLEKLNLKDNKEADEIFIISLKKFIKDYFIARDIEDIKNKDAVLITTPYSYIANNIDRKIQVWVDIGSNTWNMKIEKDLANPLVLKKSFKDGEIYTSEIEETYKKYYMYNTVYNLLKNAENIYAYKSEYSINGYIQEGGLYSTILRLIDRGGENID
ncbi:UvrD-helicase domain-containing protein [Intestinibacter bartlettii]|uniref:UvrD-helicase domain-containing protein n=1 Tax=Intestinibacter bartlettii TaxID=261299 RepID=UPI0022E67BF8|nr:UvrD-helicase domain-containing protein [Intestinibacter bartlettii]